MGGLLHFFDFSQDSMARKILAHKRHVDGKYYYHLLVCIWEILCMGMNYWGSIPFLVETYTSN